MYFLKSISEDVQRAQIKFRKHTKVKKLVLGAFLACIATILQGAGEVLPGIGYMISPLASLPILIGAMFFIQMGAMAYFLTILLLFILFPSELIIFPFTTGLLALGIGVGFSYVKKRVSIISIGAIFLTMGIFGLLYIFQFPVLGPFGLNSFSFLSATSIFSFSFLYSWLWVELARFFFNKIKVRSISSKRIME
ncbi:hypothetical protein [Bacillus sp. B15-48]|uniref:hypothetical protein n=1 Tax=Bacillus sp. B15-48 TaxID=1548601 RepID=UPI00193F33D0|nr:hypothetical protein [Bacillus sp. B15-48]